MSPIHDLNTQNDNEFKARLYAALKGFRKLPRPPLDRCMWWKSDCGNPVGSHSVSRACLNRLQHEHHVIQFRARVDISSRQADVQAELVGVNDAGVFPGFCATHDHCIFQDVDSPLSTVSQHECDLLVFRSLCREAYAKYKVASFNIEQGMVEDRPTPHGMRTLEMVYCCTDLMAHKVGMENALDAGRSEHHHFAIRFRQTPIVAASATFCPQVSFDGVPLTGGLEWLSVHILPAETGGLAVLSWEKSQSSRTAALLDSLLRFKSEWVSDVLLRYVLDNAENAFYSPAWWNGLSREKKDYFTKRYSMTILSPHSAMRNAYAISGSPLVDWEVTRMEPVS